jgi:hypothetical protein
MPRLAYSDRWYQLLVVEGVSITEEQFIDNYDQIVDHIWFGIDWYNFQADLHYEEKRLKKDNILDYISDNNDWAKKENMSSELRLFIMMKEKY